MDTLVGAGLATGMFYHAPAGTALPAYPSEALTEVWKKVGDVSEDGITQTTSKSTTSVRNWANVLKRVLLTDHEETIQAPVMDTTEESLKAVLGESNVTVIEATATHGKIVDAKLSDGNLPPEEAYLFLMKDGNAMISVGTMRGQITALGNVSYQSGKAIVWTPTITGLGDGWHIMTDDGAVIKGAAPAAADNNEVG